MAAKKNASSKAYKESDAAAEKGTARPILHSGIGRFPEKLKEAIGSEGVRAFARRAGVSEGSVFSYLSGVTFPTLDRLDAIAAAAERDPRWFIAPESEPQSQSHAVREEELKLAIEILEGELAKVGKVMPLPQRAEAIAILYDLLVTPGELPSAKVVQLVMRSVR